MFPHAAAIALLLLAAACRTPPPHSFSVVETAERVEVLTNLGRDTLAPLSDAARIAPLLTFVNARRHGWTRPWDGVPVPRLRVAFYTRATDRTPTHYFGAGRLFFTASVAGGFAFREASELEIAEFLRLVGAPPGAVD